MYEIAAELTLVIHFIFILFVGFGAFIYFINSKLLYIHFLSLIWGCYAVLTKTICPLTKRGFSREIDALTAIFKSAVEI
mgnify:CR=1 FL=1